MKLLDLIRPSVLSITITGIVLFILVLLNANLGSTSLPMSVGSTEASAWYGRELIVLEYRRNFSVSEDFIGTVLRSVKCENGRSYDLPDSTRKFIVGDYITHRSVMLPYTIAVGTKCTMTTSVVWQPTFAFVKSIQNIEEVPFIVDLVDNRPTNSWLPTNEEG